MAGRESNGSLGSWILFAITLLWCVGIVWEASRLAFSAASAGLLLLLAPVLFIAWICWAVVILATRRWSALWAATAIPFAVLPSVLVVWFPIAPKVRWQVQYRYEFASVAAAVDSGRDPSDYVGKKLGDTTVVKAWAAGQGAYFDVAERLSFKTPPDTSACGFAYLPHGKEATGHSMAFVSDFHAPWYQYCHRMTE